MDSRLLLKRQQITVAYNRLLNHFSPAQLADLLTYETPDMVYQITSRHTTTLPPLDKHLVAAEKLSEIGDTTLSVLAFDPSYRHERPGEVITNGTTTDDRLRVHDALAEAERHRQAGQYDEAHRACDEAQRGLDAFRAELERDEGKQRHHATSSDTDTKS